MSPFTFKKRSQQRHKLISNLPSQKSILNEDQYELKPFSSN